MTPPRRSRGKAASGREGGLDELSASALGRLRLLVALDALLVEGSVKAAAQALSISSPAMSRMLAQLRIMFDDDLVVRTARGMVPTPFAEELRTRLRALAAEATDLMRPERGRADGAAPSPSRPRPIVQHPPLVLNPTPLVEGQPHLTAVSRRLAELGQDADPKRRLARYVSTTGGGAGRSRPLTESEAEDALRIILDGEADPIQIGALLVAMNGRGVNANELAGMVAAARRNCLPLNLDPPAADIDWPVYLSPRVTTPPWFLLAARLVAGAGHRVLLHGFGRGLDRLYEALDVAGIPIVLSVEEAKSTLGKTALAYMPLSAIEPQLQALTSLYRLFEMRSPVNLAVQLLNPLGATSTILGVPSSTRRTLQRDAAALLGWKRLFAVASRRDVAEATPGRMTTIVMLDGGREEELTVAPTLSRKKSSPHHPGLSLVEYWQGLWTGAVRDEAAVETVVSTAAIALLATGATGSDHPACRKLARQLWNNRPRDPTEKPASVQQGKNR